MRTLLIQPDTPKLYGVGGQLAFPLGLGYIAAVLEKQHNVEVVSVGAEGLNDTSLRERVSKANPEIVGITSDTLTFQRAIEVAEIIKQVNQKTIVVVGGAHSNVLPAYPLKYSCFDISVYGEGERTVVDLWGKLGKGDSYREVKGIVFRDDDKIIVTPKRELIGNLDRLPFPARHLFPMGKYGNYYSVGTSRGCPFSCSFCSNNIVWGRRYRFRGSDSIINEVELLVNSYDAKKIYFREDLFTANKKRVMDVCNKIKEKKLNFDWECESRVDTVDSEMLMAMKDAGCKLMWFGVESGSQNILDYLNKQTTLPQIRKTYELCRKVGIRAGASFMIGIPGETIDDIQSTISLAKELKPEFAWFNILTGYPTSPLYEHILRNKLYEKEINHGILIVRTKEFSRNRLEKIQRYANRKTDKRMRRVISEFRKENLIPRRLMKGIKYLLGY